MNTFWGLKWPIKPRRVRTYLLWYYLLMTLLLAVTLGELAYTFSLQKGELERNLQVQAEQMQVAIDDELLKKVQVMQAMVISPVFANGPDMLIHQWSSGVLSAVGGLNFTLIRNGRQTVNTLVPFGAELPATLLPETQVHYKKLVRDETNVEFDFILGLLAKRWVIIIFVRVPGKDEVLALNIDPEVLQTQIAKLDLQPNQISILLDQESRVVVRTKNIDQYIGAQVDGGFASVIAGASGRGMWKGIGLLGFPIVGAYVRSPLTGWITRVSIARVHNLLSEKNFIEADLHEVFEAECKPLYKDQVTLTGPRVVLSAQMAENFGLIVHELLTNAVKYGALKYNEGAVHVHWGFCGASLRLVWSERGGPHLDAAQSREGFGTVLINRLVVDNMRGILEPLFKLEGLQVVMTVPLPRTSPA